MQTYRVFLAASLVFLAVSAQEIGFVERYALAADRSVPLQELIPGSEDHFAWNVLDLQNRGDLGAAEALLEAFAQAYPGSSRRAVLLNRQRLLDYLNDPQRALTHIRDGLGLRFDHQRERLPEEADLPTRLDPNLVSRGTLTRQALTQAGLNGFRTEDMEAIGMLADMTLDADRRRALLNVMTWPDYPKLAENVVEDLRYRGSGGFGSLNVHRTLLLTQMDQCAEAMPELLSNAVFVATYLAKLQPQPYSDWSNVPAEEEAYLDRLWGFASRLPPAQNSLKAHILYRRLAFDRQQGILDRDRFMMYIQFPRQVPYMRRDYLRRLNVPGNEFADLNASFEGQTLYDRIGSDEPLVRGLLMDLLRDADAPTALVPWFEENYLNRVFAETKLLAGSGDAQRWYGMLGPSSVKTLKDRVEADFAPDNPRLFEVDQPVRLQLVLKNIPQLIIRTYEINTINWYTRNLQEITETVDLDGLVSSDERIVDYPQPPMLRHTETFDFPALNRPGVWVVEFIGNGRSSRALVRKGRLRLTERLGAAGHVFRVYDHTGEGVTDAVVDFGGREFAADEQGTITVPFSTAPSEGKLVVRRGNFACLHTFQHRDETYVLESGFFIDPESLLPGRSAGMVVRTSLTVQGAPVDLSLLEDVALTVSTTDKKGVQTSTRIPGFELSQDQESVCEFRVPPDLRAVDVALSAKIQSVSTGQKVDLAATRHMTVGTVDNRPQPAVLLLREAADGYWLELVGKGGEPFTECPVLVTLQPRLFRQDVVVELATDRAGRISLGALSEMAGLQATSTWAANPIQVPLRDPLVRYGAPQEIVVAAGEPVVIAAESVAPQAVESLSILEVRGGLPGLTPAIDVSLADGLFVIRGLPAGDYAVLLKPPYRRLALAVLPGQRVAEDVLAPDRAARLPVRLPLQIAAAAVEANILHVQLAHASADTRVHVMVGRFRHLEDPFAHLGIGVPPTFSWHIDARLPARYVSGRVLGEEIRYVLERRYAEAFPGNMLQRPSLLLNPWQVRQTDTIRQEAKEGQSWAAVAEKPAARKMPARALAEFDAFLPGMADSQGAAIPAFDMLSSPAILLSDLRPDANGVLTVDLGALAGRQQVTVVACNGRETVQRSVALPRTDERYRDLRLARGLDPALPFGEVRTIAPLVANQDVVIENASAARIQTYTSIAHVFALFESLTGNENLAEFRFILDWPDYTIEKKLELYSKYACHELHVFLSRKDPVFFAEVIRPYLSNRRDRSVVDGWLLQEDLSAHLDPWQWSRLNAFERVAVSRSLPAHAAAVRRTYDEVCALLPRDPQAELELFLMALQGRGLAEGFGGDMLSDSLAGVGGGAGMMGGGMEGMAPAASAEADAPMVAGARTRSAKRVAGKAMKAEREENEQLVELSLQADGAVSDKRAMLADRLARTSTRRLYVAMEKTAEYAETNYWKVPLGEQSPSLVPVNRFWADWARHDGVGPFVSTHVAEATASFAEMMLAMAVLDLPCRADAPVPELADGVLRVSSSGSGLCYQKELRQLGAEKGQDLLVRQEFVDPNAEPERTAFGDRPKRMPNPVPTRRLIQCSVLVANATADPVHVDVLLQIPAGAVPLADAALVESIPVALQPFGQSALVYSFYFPRAGSFRHYPATLSRRGVVVAQADARVFEVTETPDVDTGTWDYISQFGSNEQVLAFLRTANLQEITPKLDRLAFRMQDQAFFTAALSVLREAHVFDPILWSYAVRHGDVAALQEYLPTTSLADAVGPVLTSPVLRVDSLARGIYEHKEYWPLVNARAHVLGSERTILNAQLLQQYREFCDRLAHKSTLDDEDWLTVCVYLLLQDRVGEAVTDFAKLTPGGLEEKIQVDCLQAYLAFSQGDWQAARTTARAYREYPVKRWRDRFLAVLSQCDEIGGENAAVVDPKDRDQVQAQLADTEPALELAVENRQVTVTSRNLARVTLNYYLMDVELLFSRTPFVQDASDAFSVVRPNVSEVREITPGRGTATFDLPVAAQNRNVVVEAVGAGLRRSQAYTPHSLDLQVLETYGQLRVAQAVTRQALPKVYVKVYARFNDGSVRFYKDGYTDLRGRFDYSSLSTDDLGDVSRFAILVLSEENGAIVKEANPPKR